MVLLSTQYCHKTSPIVDLYVFPLLKAKMGLNYVLLDKIVLEVKASAVVFAVRDCECNDPWFYGLNESLQLPMV